MLDTILLQQTITKAWQYQTLCLPNPSVGALLYAPQYGILSLEAHKKAGTPHAEVLTFMQAARKIFTITKQHNKLEKLDSLLNLPPQHQSQAFHTFLMQEAHGIFTNCTLYVSLEPCNHFGKTPPCVELIKAMRPQRVVVATRDLHPQASGGIENLQASGIEVLYGICQEEAQRLLYPFICWQKRKSFNLFKLAMRLNGDYTSGQISAQNTQIFTHNQRSVSDRIIISGKTFRTDLPRLDSRFAQTPYDCTHLPHIEILTRSSLDIATNPHFHNRNIEICHNPDTLHIHKGFNIIEGGFELLETLKTQIDMVLVHIAPNFYPSIKQKSTSYKNTLYELTLFHTTSHTGDISLWFKNR